MNTGRGCFLTVYLARFPWLSDWWVDLGLYWDFQVSFLDTSFFFFFFFNWRTDAASYQITGDMCVHVCDDPWEARAVGDDWAEKEGKQTRGSQPGQKGWLDCLVLCPVSREALRCAAAEKPPSGGRRGDSSFCSVSCYQHSLHKDQTPTLLGSATCPRGPRGWNLSWAASVSHPFFGQSYFS